MTNHEALFAQARAVLLQEKGRPAVYRNGDDVASDVIVICDEPGMDRSPANQTEEAQKIARMAVRVPKSVAEGGVETIDTRGSLDIDGVKWGIESIPAGSPGMHHVMLKKSLRANTAGRRR